MTTYSQGTSRYGSITPRGRMSQARRTKSGKISISGRTYGSSRSLAWQEAEYQRAAKLGAAPAIETPTVAEAFAVLHLTITGEPLCSATGAVLQVKRVPDWYAQGCPEICPDCNAILDGAALTPAEVVRHDSEVAAQAVAVAPPVKAPRAAKKTRETYSDEERAAYRETKRSEAKTMLETAARELLTSEGWHRWAVTRSRFRKYSRSNQFLVMVQCPDASMVTGFRQWKKMGRTVKKGERAIRIFAPRIVTETRKDGTKTDSLAGFLLVPVFDVSQTEGEPLALPPSEPITGDSHADYRFALEALAQSLGYSVTYEETTGCGGYCDHITKRIVVGEGSKNSQVRTLIHEIAHALGVSYKDFGREAAEVIVETVTYIVCSGIGLDTSGESVSYVAGWGESNGLEAMTTYAQTVDEIARKIEAAVQ